MELMLSKRLDRRQAPPLHASFETFEALKSACMPLRQSWTSEAAELRLACAWVFARQCLSHPTRVVLHGQAMEARLACARALARQWFGAWLRPRAPADAWLLEGLAGYLEDLFARRFLGRNELLYRRAPRAHPIAQASPVAVLAEPCILPIPPTPTLL